MPRLARHFAEGDIKAFNMLLKKMIFINLVIGLLGILLVVIGGEKILTLIYTQEYAAHVKLFIVLMISATLSGIASAFGYGITAARQFGWLVPLFLVVLGTTSAASLFLIPQFKLYGAALALILSAFIQIIGSVLIVKHAEEQFI